MSRVVWFRCLLVSLVTSFAAPVLTMVVYAPFDGEKVLDLRGVDTGEISQLSKAAVAERIQTIPMRTLHGFERITYMFSMPHWFYGWGKVIVVSLLSTLAATSLVSFLNMRDGRDAQPVAPADAASRRG